MSSPGVAEVVGGGGLKFIGILSAYSARFIYMMYIYFYKRRFYFALAIYTFTSLKKGALIHSI